MLVTDLAQLVHHLERHGGIPTLAQDGLDDDGGHTFGLRIGQKEVLQAGDRILDRDPVARRWERRAEDIGREGTNVFFVRRDFTRHTQGQQRAPVIPAGKGDDTRPTGRSPRDLDRVFDRFGTGSDQQRFFRHVARCQRIQLFSQFYIGAVGHHLKAGVGIVIFLRLGRGDDLWVAMAGVQHANTTYKVDIAIAFNIPKLGIFRILRVDRRSRRNPTRHGKLSACNELRVGFQSHVCIKHIGHDRAFCRFLCSVPTGLLLDSARHIQILCVKRRRAFKILLFRLI